MEKTISISHICIVRQTQHQDIIIFSLDGESPPIKRDINLKPFIRFYTSENFAEEYLKTFLNVDSFPPEFISTAQIVESRPPPKKNLNQLQFEF